MNDEKFDSLFKDNIDHLNDLPSNLTWDTEKMWDNYEDTYVTKKKYLKLLKYAAAAIIVMIASIFLTIKNSELNYTEISTGKGEKTKIKLSDGSMIWLNSNTKISYPARYSRKTIKIEVEGEAYFELAEKRKNPIIIIAGTTSSYVYESSFNIRAVPSEKNIEITSTKGNIELALQKDVFDNKFTFTKGERVSVHRSNKLVFREENPDNNVIAWKTGIIEFNDAPLYYIVEKLEKLYDTRIIIENTEIESTMISIRVDISDIELILSEISRISGLKIIKNETGFIIYKGSDDEVKI